MRRRRLLRWLIVSLARLYNLRQSAKLYVFIWTVIHLPFSKQLNATSVNVAEVRAVVSPSIRSFYLRLLYLWKYAPAQEEFIFIKLQLNLIITLVIWFQIKEISNLWEITDIL